MFHVHFAKHVRTEFCKTSFFGFSFSSRIDVYVQCKMYNNTKRSKIDLGIFDDGIFSQYTVQRVNWIESLAHTNRPNERNNKETRIHSTGTFVCDNGKFGSSVPHVFTMNKYQWGLFAWNN